MSDVNQEETLMADVAAQPLPFRKYADGATHA